MDRKQTKDLTAFLWLQSIVYSYTASDRGLTMFHKGRGHHEHNMAQLGDNPSLSRLLVPKRQLKKASAIQVDEIHVCCRSETTGRSKPS